MNIITQYKRNILKTWRQVTPEDFTAGVNWYPKARDIAFEVGKGNVKLGAGVIAAFSPMIRWDLNIEMARNAINSGSFVGHFFANNRKAERIFRGEEPLSVLGGNKVRAFYQCIVSGGNCEMPVIDRHSIAVALNRMLSDEDRKLYSKGRRFSEVATAYVEVAKGLNIPVAHLQAITWVNWRRRKGMVD